MDGSPSLRLSSYKCIINTSIMNIAHFINFSHTHNIVLGCVHEQTAHAQYLFNASCKIVRFRRLIIYKKQESQ